MVFSVPFLSFLVAFFAVNGVVVVPPMNELSEKEKIIQEQAKQIEEKEKEGKKILATTKNPEGERAVSG